jgi:hypothetical protein
MRTEPIQRRISKRGCANTAKILVLAILLLSGPAFGADPLISSNPAVAVFVTGAYVTWQTTTAANSRVDYGTTTAYGSNVTNASSVTHHSLTITGLTANTSYHYKVTSGTTVSGDFTFTTAANPTGTVKTVKSSGGDYTSLNTCLSAASAGWTCLTYNGATTGSISAGASGSAGSLATAQAYDAVNITGFNASGKSYTALKGFRSTGSVTSTGGTTSYVTIDNNFFDGAGVQPADAVLSNHWTISNNIVYSTGVGIYVTGDSVLIDKNDISKVTTDCMYDGGLTYSVVRNNVCHDYGPEGNGQHVDFFQTDGGYTVGGASFGYVLFEGNTAQRCVDGTGNCHFIIDRDPYNTPTNMIVRYNFVQALDGSGVTLGTNENIFSNRFNNNTFAIGTRVAEAGTFYSSYYANYSKSLNNICYDCTNGNYGPWDTGTGIVNNYNVAYTTTNTSATWDDRYQAEATYSTLKNINPSFVNYPYDMSLNSGSALINAGTNLTTVTSGCGTSSLVLADVRWFQPGWAGVQADTLAIGETIEAATIAQIKGISYSDTASTSSGNVTFDSAVSCTNGNKVWLYKKSDGVKVIYGSAPDIGAWEYGAASMHGTGVEPRTPIGVRIVQ